MLKKVAFTLLPITDVHAARHFYETILGLQIGANGGHEGKFWLEYDLPGGGCLALSNATPNQPSMNQGATIAFEVEDLDRLIAHLKDHQVEVIGDIIHGPHCRMIPCRDPAGNGLMLHQINPD